MTTLELAGEIMAQALKLVARKSSDHLLLVDEEGEVHLYLFRRRSLPILGLYGYYAAHFIEVWEGERLAQGIKEVIEQDEYLSKAAKALLGLGEAIVRVGRVRGKYGDPHVSRFFETRNFQVIREVLEVGGAAAVPRVAPGNYEWNPPREVCESGVVGYLDGFWIRFSKRRIGFVRGLHLFVDCKLVLSQAEYESMGDLEERMFGELLVKKIPYRLAASMLNASEVECCGYTVKELYSPSSWETPLWKRVYDRFEVSLRPLHFQRSACDQRTREEPSRP